MAVLGVQSRSTRPASRSTARRQAQKGVFAQGTGTSRGGRTSKIHALMEAAGRSRILLVPPGNTSDMTMVPALIEGASGRFATPIAATMAPPSAPPFSSKKPRSSSRPSATARPSSPMTRRPSRSHLVERLWCRLKGWRRIATRYDKLATNHMAGVFLAAAITFRCN